MNIHRVAPAIIAVLGIVFLLLVLPGQIDPFVTGTITPGTIPSATVIIGVICAVFMVFERPSGAAVDPEFLIRLAVIVTMVIGAAVALRYLSYQFVMPVFALAIMLFIGERRWPLLAFGACLPVVIWLLIEVVLGRPLP